MTPEEVKGKLISLHFELKNLKFYLLKNESVVGKDYEANIQSITEVQNVIEREMKRMDLAAKHQNIDEMVKESLRQAGIDPNIPLDKQPGIKRNEASDPEVKRMASVAITEIQTAQMWAVKAVTWK